MRRQTYVIGRFENGNPNRSQASYYVEGFCVPATWTRRDSANGYSNRRQAIKEARTVAAEGFTTFVEPQHDPFGTVQPVWSLRRDVGHPDGNGRQKCTHCARRSIAGMMRGHGLCPFHWAQLQGWR